MQNLFAGFFVSALIHVGIVLSLSNVFSIDLLDFNNDYSQPIPAYLIFEKPNLVSKKKVKTIIKKDTVVSISKTDLSEIVLKADQEILVLEDMINTPAILEEKEINASQQDKILFFSSLIEGQIQEVWKKPIASQELSVELMISLVPTGEILDVNIKRSSGNDAFDRSALIAVAKVNKFENLAMPAQLFNNNFRQFTLVFKPN